MPGTPTSKYAIPTLAGTDLARDIDTLVNSSLNSIDSKMVGYSEGVLAARPVSTPGSPGVAGRLYRATDADGRVFRDTGVGWAPVLSAFETAVHFEWDLGSNPPESYVLWVPVMPGTVVRLKSLRYVLRVAGTSPTRCNLLREEVDVPGLTNLTLTQLVAETVPTGGPITLNDRDALRVVFPTLGSGNPRQPSVAAILEISG